MAVGPCQACGTRLPRSGRCDMRFCDGTCRMRSYRMRHYGTRPPRPRGARQPMPRYHQSPSLLRVAARMRERAERAERASSDLQQQQTAQAAALAAANQEIAELRRQLEEAQRAQQAGPNATPNTPPPGTASGDPATGNDGDEPTDQSPPRSRGRRQPGASADRPTQDLATRLRHCQQMYRELLAVADELQRSMGREQTHRAAQARLLEEALVLAIEGEPPLSGDWSAESAARVQRRATVLTTENEQLRRDCELISAERQRLSARLLAILLPGQAANHASGMNYEVASDPLIPQKRSELTLLDTYALWQSQHMRHVTARTLDPNKPLDEQALEAALAARWRLITQPPLEVRNRRQPPRWVVLGFRLDPASERYLLRQSQRRMDAINERIRTGNDGGLPS